MQNRTPAQVFGSPDAPFLNNLASACGIGTNYHWVWHAAFPPATSGEGTVLNRGCEPSMAGCSLSSESVFSQLRGVGRTWRVYAQGMTKNCSGLTTGLYTSTHNPALFYSRIASDCQTWDTPLGAPTQGAFASDIDTGMLADYIFVVPDLCDSGHDCVLGRVDEWLQTWITKIVGSATYRAGGTAIFITWDDSGTDPAGVDDCAKSNHPACLVPLLVVSPSTLPGTKSAENFSHYSLLRTTEELLGIPQLLGSAAQAASLRAAFRL